MLRECQIQPRLEPLVQHAVESVAGHTLRMGKRPYMRLTFNLHGIYAKWMYRSGVHDGGTLSEGTAGALRMLRWRLPHDSCRLSKAPGYRPCMSGPRSPNNEELSSDSGRSPVEARQRRQRPLVV